MQYRVEQAQTPISQIVPIAEYSMYDEYLTLNGIRYAPAGVPLFTSVFGTCQILTAGSAASVLALCQKAVAR